VNLSELFDFSLKERRDAVALEFQNQTYTFGELDSGSNRAAHWLLSNGFNAGDRLCVYLPNCVEMIDIYLACVKSGIIFVPINILYRDREISHILRDPEPRGIVSDESITTEMPVWAAI
jgi:malonyl-CoA/methylmalonyl-CoA synthetase